ncbi:MAG: O-antigen ligase family protein [Planctomycetota bacterium]
MVDEDEGSRFRSGLIAVAAVALVAAVLVPCVTPTTPTVYFDTDPRLSAGLGMGADVVTELGPRGTSALQLITVLLAVVGTAAAVWAGARLSWWVVTLAGLGGLAAAAHMVDGNARWEDWTRGGAWLTAASVGVAGYHLAQLPAARRWVVALLCAATVPLAAEAVWDVRVQHAEDVRYFEAYQDELLALRGIEPGSEQAALYERRLRTPEASGVFTTSNLLASVAGALGLGAAALGVMGLLGARWRSGAAWVALGCGAAGGLTVWLATSRGAAVAVVMVAGLLAWLVATRSRNMPRWVTPALAVALVALAFGAVLVRGAMGPPDPPADGFVPGRVVEGERSLLFRAQYWSASARIAAHHPLRGVGTRGFADAYPAAKDPLNPETVTSAHNVFVDQITMLGAGGVAWSALLLAWLGLAGWRCRDAVGHASTSDEVKVEGQGRPVHRLRAWMALAMAFSAACGIFGVCLAVRWPTLYYDASENFDPIRLWLFAAIAFSIVAAVLGVPGILPAYAQRSALFITSAVVLVHNQIEMTFVRPESMALMWLIVGGAAAGAIRAAQSPTAAKKNRWVSLALAGVAAAVLLTGMGVYVAGVNRHESAMAEAAAALRRNEVPLAVERLERAQHAAGWDTEALRWRVTLHAAEPMGYLVQAGHEAEAQGRVDEALAWIDEAVAGRGLPSTAARLRGQLLDRWAMVKGDHPEDITAAQEAYETLRPRSPYNVQDAWTRADLARRAGEFEQAASLFREVLALREQLYLDAADPLTASQLAEAQEFLAAAARE